MNLTIPWELWEKFSEIVQEGGRNQVVVDLMQEFVDKKEKEKEGGQ